LHIDQVLPRYQKEDEELDGRPPVISDD
jgi:hypothetical protein